MTDTPSGAIISSCGRYRYLLWRRWGAGKIVTWVMMNPSTADAMKDDATIRKCVGFAKHWGFDGIQVVNLFAWRARDPLSLLDVADPYGPDYTAQFDEAIARSSLVITAWGCESTLWKARLLRARALVVMTEVQKLPVPVECLGMSKRGTPYHPLMLAYTTPRRSLKAMLEGTE